MTDSDITIGYLADHLEWVPVVANWFYDQWNDIFVANSVPVKAIEKGIVSECNYDKVPLTLVAIKDEKVVGTVGLKQCDMSIRKNLSPWLAGLYVASEHRNKGIGSLLTKTLIEHARSLEINKLYLHTFDAADFYKKRGWDVLERTEYLGGQANIMEKGI